ncbi:auxilin-like protein 1 isoform X2 [Cornus florida]|uniref:auxilin-like protein 1 isoform X2 n=1 Tax=Cornus florida TaxID=4283 RepID=UPI00289A6281|nr:auxilin-like protein 1 isoform X2 [Cornus florida]
MENLSHSLSRKAYNANGFAAQTIYTDVFRGPPKFGASTLSPRVEDYTEIFGSFRASRASSIPILDLPVVQESDASFDVRSFDYSQVFGGFNGLDFAVSYQEVFSKSNSGDDSSEDAWTPAASGSLSDESDPFVLGENNQSSLNEDSGESSVECKQFNISYNKANQRYKEDVANGMTHVTQLHAVPGFTYVVNGTSQKIEDEIPPLEVLDDLNLSMDFSRGMKEGKVFRKTMSLPPNCTSSLQTFGSDHKLPKGYGKTNSFPNEPFLTLSDISLRTRPSHLPPPSRPPPALSMKEGDCDRQNSKLTYSKSYAFERKADDGSPPFLDVEVDASSSAVASAAAMKDAMKKVQAKLKSAKELKERKKEGLQCCMKLGLKNDLKDEEEKPNKSLDGLNSFKDVRKQGTCESECSEVEAFAGDEKPKVMKSSQVVSDYIEGERNINLGKKYTKEKHGKEFRSSTASHRSERTVAWREGTQFYEVVETDEPKTNIEQAKDEKISMQNKQFHEQGQEKKAAKGAFELQKDGNRKNKAARDAHIWKGSVNKLEVAEGACKLDEDKGMSEATRESCLKGQHGKKVEVAEEVCGRKQNVKKPTIIQLQGDIEKILTEADICEKHESLTQVQRKENEREVTQKLRDANGRTENEKRFGNAHERKENERRHKEMLEREKYEKRLGEAIEQADSEKRLKEALEREEKEKQQQEAREREEHLKRQKKALEQKENEKRLKEAFEREENEKRLKEAFEQEENEKRLKEAFEREENEKRLKEAFEWEENEKRLREALEQEENEKRLKEGLEREENEKRSKKALEQEETEKGLKITIEHEETKKKQKLASEREVHEKSLMGENKSELKRDLELEENAKKQKEAYEREENEKMQNKTHDREEKRLEEAWEQEENKKISQVTHERVKSDKILREAFNHEEIDKRSEEASEREETESRSKSAGKQDKLKGRSKDHEQIDRDKDESKKLHQETCVHKEGENLKASNGPCKLDNNKKLQPTQVCREHDKSIGKLKETEEALSCEGDRIMRTEPEDTEKGREAIGVENELVEERFNSCCMVHDELQYEKNQLRMEDTENSLRGQESVTKSGEADIGIGQTHIERKKKASEMVSDPESLTIAARERGERGTHIKEDQVIFDQEESEDKLMSWQVVKEWVEINERRMGTAQPTVSEGKRNAQKVSTYQKEERKEKNINEAPTPEEREKEERMKREIELEQDRLKKIEEEREREREREKDRMSVERATHEVRERAFAEERERAERAAVERATAEVRQRTMAEARERLEKACADAKERSLAGKASMEARLRAERAAVERATAEARERAVEKAMSEKAAFEARARIERSVSDKFYGSSRDGVMRQCSSSSDLQFQRGGLSNGSKYSYSSVHCGVEVETAQRCKARLERYQRTTERAAKALAEKNVRDLLAQREQAERNRLADVLDAEVKRWSNGKEGNLRALLSTLQYILGPDSGWQPIPLTEVITTVAVKKAYRKATLCVHPDKLQQRGASIQQKYICEKVFDLLKEAWNKFNSEER